MELLHESLQYLFYLCLIWTWDTLISNFVAFIVKFTKLQNFSSPQFFITELFSDIYAVLLSELT
jgi:hypothetical protein